MKKIYIAIASIFCFNCNPKEEAKESIIVISSTGTGKVTLSNNKINTVVKTGRSSHSGVTPSDSVKVIKNKISTSSNYINGKYYTLKGSNIEITNNKVFVDGEEVQPNK